MINSKEKLNRFLNNSKDYPVLAAFSVGFYALVFYFSNNFDLVNSWSQLFFFIFYYVISTIVVFYLFYKVLQKSRFSRFAPQSIIILTLILLFVYLFGVTNLLGSYKKIGLLLGLLFIVFKFKIRNHKYLTLLIFLMSIIPSYKLLKIIELNFINSNEWQQQPDDILSCQFKKKLNVYYIQPDGYTSDLNLRGELYKFDNSIFDNWLKDEKFTLYDDYRSNYESTLFSNSSCFSMKHHYSKEFSNFKYARDYIVGENPVLKIFKNNNYKTIFITERPYLLMNRPKVFYDYSNFELDEIPRFKDGWQCFKDITQEIESQLVQDKKTSNFFFIEKFNPGHINPSKIKGSNVEKERIEYLKSLQTANVWLKKIITIIEKKDPSGIIIIGADHGGFVGFESTSQSQDKITNPKLLYSIFGAKLAIKWNDVSHIEYDTKLKTTVNLFRVVFSYLSEDKKLLNNLQPNTSYNCYDSSDLTKIYMAIDEKGSSHFFK